MCFQVSNVTDYVYLIDLSIKIQKDKLAKQPIFQSVGPYVAVIMEWIEKYILKAKQALLLKVSMGKMSLNI